MLTDDDIKQVFFQCDNKDPKGFYPTEVDIFEFARKIEALILYDLAKKAPK